MKKIACTILIFITLLMSSCSFITGQTSGSVDKENEIVKDHITDIKDDVAPGDNDVDDSNQDQENLDNNDDDNDKNPDSGNTEDKTDDESKPEVDNRPESKTINDYILSLVDSDYCNDADFLQAVVCSDGKVDLGFIYVSNDGEGSGNINSPMSLEDAVDSAKPGDTIYLRGGEYIFTETIWLSISGTKDKYITIKSYPGEKAVLTTTPENVSKYDENGEYVFFGLDAGCSYLIFEDLEICGVTDEYVAAFACYDGGQNHIIFRNNEIHDLNTTYTEGGCNAFLFLGEKKSSINNIMLINNKCYDLTLGYSEAVSFAGNCEYCYVIGNNVYDNTNIGIDFYGNAGYCSTESLDQARYCVAAYNTVYNCNSPYADCAGIYVDGGRNCLIEGNLIYGSQYGIEIGSEEFNDKYPVTEIVVRNNLIIGNTVCGMRVGGYDKKSSGTVKNTYIYNNTFVDNLGDFDVIISKADGIVFANNVFFGNDGIFETEFNSSYIKNLKFYNNCFDKNVQTIELYDKEMSIDEFNSLYGSDNLSFDLSLNSEYSLNTQLVGCAEYAPKYDFYLIEREKNLIGAVEIVAEEE